VQPFKALLWSCLSSRSVLVAVNALFCSPPLLYPPPLAALQFSVEFLHGGHGDFPRVWRPQTREDATSNQGLRK
jgi:hypothetical protein